LKKPDHPISIILSFCALWGASYYLSEVFFKHCGLISPLLFSLFLACAAYWTLFELVAHINDHTLGRRHAVIGTMLAIIFGFFDSYLEVTPFTMIVHSVQTTERPSSIIEHKGLVFHFSTQMMRFDRDNDPEVRKRKYARYSPNGELSPIGERYYKYFVWALDAERGTFKWGIPFDVAMKTPGLKYSYRGIWLRELSAEGDELKFRMSNGYRYRLNVETGALQAIPPSWWELSFQPPECSG
jgi:hypothetical protein